MRGDCAQKSPAAGIILTAGCHKFPVVRGSLEQAKHDRPNKGECDIGGNNAQSADERTEERHWESSLVHVAARCNAEASKRFRHEKVSSTVRRASFAVRQRG